MVGFAGRFGHGVSMLTTIGVTSVTLDAQRSNVVPATLRKGFARNLIKGTKKSLPATLGIGIIGRKL